jgi:hypothetical protein
MAESILDQHMAVMGRVIAKFVSTGLLGRRRAAAGVAPDMGRNHPVVRTGRYAARLRPMEGLVACSALLRLP